MGPGMDVESAVAHLMGAALAGDGALADAVCEIAEAIAATGVVFVDAGGRAIGGVDDRMAVRQMLAVYRHALQAEGNAAEAHAVEALASRVSLLPSARGPGPRRPWTRRGA